MSSLPRRFAIMVFAAAALAGTAGAHAQGVQVLDSVDGYATNSVLNMGFRDPLPRIDFQKLEVGVGSVVACQRAITQGLYCIDGSILRFWPNTKSVVAGVIPDIDVLACTDPVLGFDRRKPNPCTSVTVDYNGAIWLAGRKANSHSLVKVVEKSKLGTACGPGGPWRELAALAQDAPHPPQAAGAYCAREIAPGRPVLVDINPVDGELGAEFPFGAGIVGLEERKTVVFFPDALDGQGNPVQPVTLASGKMAWGLIGNEQLLGAAVLQFGALNAEQNYVLATTTLGRVLAKEVGNATPAFKVFDIPGNRTDPAIDYSRCDDDTAQFYGIRVSSQSERVYVSDRACGQVHALNWLTSGDAGFPAECDDPGTTNSFCLVNAREKATSSSPAQDVTLATADTAVATSPDGISIAPGIGIDLADCGIGETCTLVADGTDPNGYSGAVLTGVVLEGPKSLMTVFQVKGIPDCRHWADGPGCKENGLPVGGVLVPGGYLNVYPLLPIEVTSLFPPGMPPLLISPHYRGQGDPAMFDAFVGIPEPGVQFRDTFTGIFNVADLAGSNLGCGGSTTNRPDLDVDIVTTVSEVYGSVGGPADDPSNEHVDMLVNTGCFNPTQIAGGRWSLYAYNLEPNAEPANDGYYATLMRSLYADLLSAQQKTACEQIDIKDADGNLIDTREPLSPATCANLTTKWESANVMLERCITSSTYPRQSQAVNNCNAFLSQFAQYESVLEASQLFGIDPANRRGELEVRTQVIRYMFTAHFVPVDTAEWVRGSLNRRPMPNPDRRAHDELVLLVHGHATAIAGSHTG